MSPRGDGRIEISELLWASDDTCPTLRRFFSWLGCPGSGKTTLALALSHALGWPMLDKDTLKSVLLTCGIAEALAGPASYEVLLSLGRDLLVEQRLSVILDSPAGYPSVVERAQAIALDGGARLSVILCLAEQGLAMTASPRG